MSDERKDTAPPVGGKGVGTNDTTEYSASKAPETAAEAEEPTPYSDMRLIPGGRRGATAPVGMHAMDRDDVPSGARELGQVRYGDSPAGGE